MVNASAVGRISVPERGRGAAAPHPAAASGAKFLRRPDGGGREASGASTQAALAVAQLANGLRGLMSKSQVGCRIRRISPEVSLVEYSSPGTRRLVVEGVHTCKSPMCAQCYGKWQRTRSAEIKQAIDNHGAARTGFGTFTMRHHRRMPVALQQRLLGAAYGNLWSGRGGQAAARRLGGKPESVRAHDRTWSDAHGWHPHLHALLFLQREGVSESELFHVLDGRWVEALPAALKRFKRLVYSILTAPERRSKLEEKIARTTSDAVRARAVRSLARLSEEHLRDRAMRVFGTKLVPRKSSFDDSIRQLERDLRYFSEKNIAPTRANGVRFEYVRAPNTVQSYLAKLGLKLGFELSHSGSKLGRTDENGLVHYGLWEVAQLCTIHGHELRTPARRAWSELFRASFGTQTITFSSRKRLRLGPDPYAEGKEPDEQAAEEWKRWLGGVPNDVWDGLVREQGQGLLVSLIVAHEKGLLEDLPYVTAAAVHPAGVAAPALTMASKVEPPPVERLHWPSKVAELEAEKRGRVLVRAAWDAADNPPHVDNSLFREELRYRLQLAMFGGAGPPRKDTG